MAAEDCQLASTTSAVASGVKRGCVNAPECASPACAHTRGSTEVRRSAMMAERERKLSRVWSLFTPESGDSAARDAHAYAKGRVKAA